jgi:hypothetical protein
VDTCVRSVRVLESYQCGHIGQEAICPSGAHLASRIGLNSTFALFRRYAAGARAYSNTALMGRDSFEKVP